MDKWFAMDNHKNSIDIVLLNNASYLMDTGKLSFNKHGLCSKKAKLLSCNKVFLLYLI